MEISPKIFKAYDIRGVYGDDLTDEIAHKVGQGFASYAKTSPIIVGYDSRLSSPALKEALINGILDQGADVIDIGLCSTSCFYFTLAESGFGGGIMVTASHAPKEFNGFKPMFKDATPPTREQLSEIKDICLEKEFLAADKKGSVTKQDPTEKYVAAVRSSIKEKLKPLKVVMDAGNGTAGLYIEKVFADLGLSLIPIYLEPDGNFPNHETNPKLPENRAKLAERIVEEKADLGFMFDGDSDRLGILDRNGNLFDYSLTMAIIAEYLVKKSTDKNKKVVIEVRTSSIVRDWVKKAGGSVEVSTCWTIPIKLKMKADPEIVFGGETSGHYMFPAIHETDDGIFGALTFLQAISAKEESVDEIIEAFRKKYYVIDETNFKMDDMEKADAILGKIKDKFASEGAKIVEIDGVSAIFPDWWFNLRKSESEPVIRLNLEANSKKLMEEKTEEITRFIEDNK